MALYTTEKWKDMKEGIRMNNKRSMEDQIFSHIREIKDSNGLNMYEGQTIKLLNVYW